MQVIDANIDLRSIEYRARQSLTRYNSEFQAVLSGPMYLLDLHCVLRRQATSSCRGHVDESVTGLSLSPHLEHGTGCRHN